MRNETRRKLIGRILFLGGKPIVTELNKIHIGEDVPQQVEFDRRRGSRNWVIMRQSRLPVRWETTYKDILVQILNDEDRHMDELEELLDRLSK